VPHRERNSSVRSIIAEEVKYTYNTEIWGSTTVILTVCVFGVRGSKTQVMASQAEAHRPADFCVEVRDDKLNSWFPVRICECKDESLSLLLTPLLHRSTFRPPFSTSTPRVSRLPLRRGLLELCRMLFMSCRLRPSQTVRFEDVRLAPDAVAASIPAVGQTVEVGVRRECCLMPGAARQRARHPSIVFSG
jgi:hypothetical protein